MGNLFLEHHYAPVEREYTSARLEVTGRVPEYLDGRYLLNTPNPVNADPETYHWFLGDGMVHGVRLRGGRAEWYRNRWIRTPYVAGLLGERPPLSEPSPGVNTNVIEHAGRTIALLEGGHPVWALTEELETVGVCDFGGTMCDGYTAHPKRDPKTGELHGVSYRYGLGNRVQYSVIGTDGRARRIVEIEVTGRPMMHDFSLTERYVVFYDLPVTFDAQQDPARGVSKWQYRWNPAYPARIGVMPRDGGNADVRWFETEQCFVFHSLNAYDDGDRVMLDVIRYPKMFDRALNGPTESRSTLDRWTVDLAADKVFETRIDDHVQDFPRMDERLIGQLHRYGYTVNVSKPDSRGGLLYKHDLRVGSVQTRQFGPGRVPSEFVFTPSDMHSGEDEGVLMGFVHDTTADRSDLVLLDAGTLDTVAEVHLPARVPAGFHGNWMPSRE